MVDEVDQTHQKPTKTQICRFCSADIQWRFVYGKSKSYNLDWTEHECDRSGYEKRVKRSQRAMQELEQGFERAIHS